MVRLAINGFGRIGRNAFKIAFDRNDTEIVAINDLTDAKTLAHLLKYDSNYGTYEKEVSYDDQGIIVDGKHIRVLAEKDPANLPWRDLNVDVVIESTGFFCDPAKAHAHIDAGARKVVISAPAKGEGAKTIVLGVNEDTLTVDDQIISNASCTTNCIAPVMKVLEDNIGIDKAMMTTVHSYTASQKLQDAPAKDLREARNAAENIVPTTTGASKAAALTIPSLQGRFNGLSVRVPTPVVSLSDITAVTKRPTSKEEINNLFKKAASEDYYQGILDATEEELVSIDFRGNSHSTIVDLKLTDVIDGTLIKVVAWYDNEWGYSNRLVELSVDFGKMGQNQFMHIYLGADHRGYELKNNVINWLTSRQITFTDFGANFFDAEDDYNDYAKKVTSALLGDHSGDAFGVLLCGSAQGMCMQANRYKGIRAAICHTTSDAIETRGHNDANVLCISADSNATNYADILNAFLTSEPLTDPKYQRRNEKLDID